VEQEVSRVTQGLITLTNGDQLVAPTTRKRLVKTTILLQDSQTAVIGGLLDDQKTYNQSEVPGLGCSNPATRSRPRPTCSSSSRPRSSETRPTPPTLPAKNSSYCMKRVWAMTASACRS
jgi:hypothetical protein